MPGQLEIERKGDLEIGFAMDDRDGMDAMGDERGDFVGGTCVMGLQGGEKEIMSGSLRGFHRKEIGAGNRFGKSSPGIRAVEGIGDQMSGRGRAVGIRSGEDFFDECGRDQRAGGIMDCDEIRWIRREGLESVQNRGAALGSASDDVAKFGIRRGERGEFCDALRRAYQHGAIDGGAVLKGAQRPFENGATTQWSHEFVEPHAGARAGGDKDGCGGHGL